MKNTLLTSRNENHVGSPEEQTDTIQPFNYRDNSIYDQSAYLTAKASRKLAKLGAAASSFLMVGALYGLYDRHIELGGGLLALTISSGVITHALFEDAADKRNLDEYGLPYTLRLRAEMFKRYR